MATCVFNPVRLKSSSMNSSDISAKYSWPRREQNDDIQDSGLPEDVDMLLADSRLGMRNITASYVGFIESLWRRAFVALRGGVDLGGSDCQARFDHPATVNNLGGKAGASVVNIEW